MNELTVAVISGTISVLLSAIIAYVLSGREARRAEDGRALSAAIKRLESLLDAYEAVSASQDHTTNAIDPTGVSPAAAARSLVAKMIAVSYDIASPEGDDIRKVLEREVVEEHGSHSLWGLLIHDSVESRALQGDPITLAQADVVLTQFNLSDIRQVIRRLSGEDRKHTGLQRLKLKSLSWTTRHI